MYEINVYVYMVELTRDFKKLVAWSFRTTRTSFVCSQQFQYFLKIVRALRTRSRTLFYVKFTTAELSSSTILVHHREIQVEFFYKYQKFNLSPYNRHTIRTGLRQETETVISYYFYQIPLKNFRIRENRKFIVSVSPISHIIES